MATRVTLTTRPDGSLAVVKTPLTGDRADRVAEAAWLRQAAGRGVVELLEASSATLVTAWVPGNTLRTGDRSPEATAAVLATLGRSLANLHDAGLVHGKLSLDHVIVGPDGPVLCSPRGRVVGSAVGSAVDPALDSLGLARCLTALLERWDDLDVKVANRSAWQRLAERLGDEHDPLPLRRAAVAFDRLATAAELVPAESTGDDTRPRRTPWRFVPGNRRRPGIALVLGAVALSLAGLVLASGLASVGPLGNTDRSGAAAPPEVVVDGDRYRVGEPGDVALVVERRCPGQPLVLLLDRARSTIWRFDDSSFDADRFTAIGDPVGRVPGATDLVVEPADDPDGPSCPTIWAIGPAGRRVVVDPATGSETGEPSSLPGSEEAGG